MRHEKWVMIDWTLLSDLKSSSGRSLLNELRLSNEWSLLIWLRTSSEPSLSNG